MKIKTDSVVSLAFELHDAGGKLIDNSSENGPLVYLHGHNNIPDGLEKALTGHVEGDNLKVHLQAAEGFGEFDPGLVQEVHRSDLEGVENLQEGMQFPAETPEGPMMLQVLKIQGDMITLDGNHPLAGEELHFDVTVEEIRSASKEELEHGHAHGPGGHEHS